MATAREWVPAVGAAHAGEASDGAVALLEVEALHLRLGRKTILRGIDLRLNPGEVVLLIGPSGSGKSSLLRAIAGLEPLEKGRIRLQGDLLDDGRGTALSPEQRRMAMVFQEHALWPHLTVEENVQLVIPGRSGREKTHALLERMGIAQLAKRRPHEISGGQRQRVGLARALAVAPSLMLMDEPLSSLDVELREQLRLEIRRWLRELGIGALIVSHDPDDLWRLADRVVVLADGRVVQDGSPQNLYDHPQLPWIARFTGAQGPFPARWADGMLDFAGQGLKHPGFGGASGSGWLFIRPERVEIRGEAEQGLAAVLRHCAFERGHYRSYWELPGLSDALVALSSGAPPAHARLWIDPQQLFFFPRSSQE